MSDSTQFDKNDPLNLKGVVVPDNLKPYDTAGDEYHLPLATAVDNLWPEHNVICCVWQNRDDSCARMALNFFPKNGLPENGVYLAFSLTGQDPSLATLDQQLLARRWKYKPTVRPEAVRDVRREAQAFVNLLRKVALHPRSANTQSFGLLLTPQGGQYEIGIHHGGPLNEPGRGANMFTCASTLSKAVRIFQFHAEGHARWVLQQQQEREQRSIQEREEAERQLRVLAEQKIALAQHFAKIVPGDIVLANGNKKQTALRVITGVEKVRDGYEVTVRSIPACGQANRLVFHAGTDCDRFLFVSVPNVMRTFLLKITEGVSMSKRFYIDLDGKWVLRLTERLVLTYKHPGGPANLPGYFMSPCNNFISSYGRYP